MLGFLIKTLMALVLIIGLLITIVGAMWVLSLMIDEWLDLGLVERIRAKAREILNGETMARLHERRKSRSSSNSQKTKRLKRTIFKRQNHRQKVQIQSNNANKES